MAYQKLKNVIHSSSSYPRESLREIKEEALRLQDRSSNIMPKLNNIFLALQNIYGPIELEWSVVDDEIYIYQMRVQERKKLKPFDWSPAENKQQIYQGGDYFGHKIVKVPAVTVKNYLRWSLTQHKLVGREVSQNLKSGRRYALVGDFPLFLEEYARGSRISQATLETGFSNLGVIINTGRPVPLGAHYSEFFSRNNIFIINVGSEDLSAIKWKEVTADGRVVKNIQIGEQPIWVVVDALQEKAAIFLD